MTDGERFELSSRVDPSYSLSRRALSATQATVPGIKQTARFSFESSRRILPLDLQPMSAARITDFKAAYSDVLLERDALQERVDLLEELVRDGADCVEAYHGTSTRNPEGQCAVCIWLDRAAAFRSSPERGNEP